MQTGADVLRGTDWTRTFHAYGQGSDAPEHLVLLFGGDTEGHERALEYLYGAILHQGTVYPATAPAALLVAGVLPGAPADLRRDLLGFLSRVGSAVGPSCPEEPVPDRLPAAEVERIHTAMGSEDEEEAAGVWEEEAVGVLMRRGVEELRAAAPVLYEAVRPFLTHTDRRTRMRAVEAAGALARLGGLEPDLSGAADMAETRDEGAAIVLALGQNGVDTAEFLSHADPAIRACAALAPGQSTNPAATRELAAALADPGAADAWFEDRPDRFCGHVRLTLVGVLAERSTPADAERLLPVLQALVPLSSTYTGAVEISPLPAPAFPDGEPGAPTELQRAYLSAVVDHGPLWEGGVANFALALRLLGLPCTREGLLELAIR
ncbi:hypothetical protein ACOALZ_13440 [Nocardiopsis algeriensis]|uniref:hypothetical protein n=1 Tax=Nocardiopsis algeriensis TaxID=1478215 RepID=UPI003B43BAE3